MSEPGRPAYAPGMPSVADSELALRTVMVSRDIEARGVREAAVLAAMLEVPRHVFVPEDEREHAYDDMPLPIGEGQTISQPYVVARMAEVLALGSDDRVLELGTGCGYAAAVMSRIVREVFSLERLEHLSARAAATLGALGYTNIHLRVGDGSLGWPDAAPFSAITVAAAGPEIPPALLEQLELGGRLVMPVGTEHAQRLTRVTRRTSGHFVTEGFDDVRFVPIIGAAGFRAR